MTVCFTYCDCVLFSRCLATMKVHCKVNVLSDVFFFVFFLSKSLYIVKKLPCILRVVYHNRPCSIFFFEDCFRSLSSGGPCLLLTNSYERHSVVPLVFENVCLK